MITPTDPTAPRITITRDQFLLYEQARISNIDMTNVPIAAHCTGMTQEQVRYINDHLRSLSNTYDLSDEDL